MGPFNIIEEALLAGKQVVTISGKAFTGDELKEIFATAYQRASSKKTFPNGVSYNASFMGNEATFYIDYRDGRPAPSPNSSPRPTPSPQQPRVQTPPPKPTQPSPRPGPIQPESALFKLIYSVDTPSPDPHAKIVIQADGLSTLVDQINVVKAPVFVVQGRNSQKIANLIQKEYPEIVYYSEGAVQGKIESRSSFNGASFTMQFDLGMTPEMFYDHLAKGKKAAKTIYQRLTHGATVSDLMKAFLCYAYFQKEVKYADDYLRATPFKPNGNMHMAYGPLMLKKGVCEGYTWGLIHMLRVAGIRAEQAWGYGPGGGNHAWAKIYLNGRVYNIDPTIMGRPGCVFLQGFLKSDAFFTQRGYRLEHGPVSTGNEYDDAAIVLNLILQEKELALRKGADREILNSSIQGGI